MTESSVVPLEPWGEIARRLFWSLLFGFGPVLAILDMVGVIDRSDGFWLVLSIALAVVWAVAGVLWALAAWRRRRAARQLPD